VSDYTEQLGGDNMPQHSKLFRHRIMKDSDTYWAIFDEGRMEEAKAGILFLAKKRFGPAEESMITRLCAISDLDLLDRILDRLIEATSWHDLLETP
jgi:hypothetical protein